MKRRSLMLVAVLSCCILGCPGASKTVGSNPYLVAHTVINQASLALTVAEGVFNQWLYAQSDAKKIRKAKLTFSKVQTLVAHGLKLAHDGVYIAEKAKETPDVAKLLLQADGAWSDLREFLVALLGDGNYDIVVQEHDADPDEEPEPPPGGVGTRILAMTAVTNPLDALPMSIIPEM